MKKLIQSLQQLVLSYAISGYEWELNVTNVIQDLIGFSGERINNNLIYSLGKGKKIIMISAHMDEVGFFVTNRDRNFYSLIPIGSIDITDVIGKKLLFFQNNNIYRSKQVENVKSFSELKVNVQDELSIGTIGTFEKTFTNINDVVIAPSLDNKVGCLALIELIKEFSNLNSDLYTYVFCFACREEVGSNGIVNAIKTFNPSLCIDIDSAYAKPLKGKTYKNWRIPEIGSGPAIQLLGEGFIVSSEVRRLVEKVANANNIAFQYEIPSSQAGGTNSQAVLNSGCEIMQINIPVANQHSAESKASLRDIQNIIKLTKQILLNV